MSSMLVRTDRRQRLRDRQLVVLPAAEIGEVLGQADDQRARGRRLTDQLARALEVGVDVLARGHLHRRDDQVRHGGRSLSWPRCVQPESSVNLCG